MGDTTAIAWTDHTFNLAWGCTKVSPGCANCYAENLTTRRGETRWGPTGTRRTFGAEYWRQPEKWNRQAEREGRIHRVFCSSMCDIFEDHPTITQERARLWPIIRATPWLDWQLLTKRAERIAANLPSDWGAGYPNAWLGVSVEDQKRADLRLPRLLELPAAVHFASVEPLLEPVNIGPYLSRSNMPGLRAMPGFRDPLGGLEWVIVGGESGPGYRPMDHAWPRAIRDQCRAAGVAFFFKQSAAPRTEMGIRLDGEIVREYPATIRTVAPNASVAGLFG